MARIYGNYARVEVGSRQLTLTANNRMQGEDVKKVQQKLIEMGALEEFRTIKLKNGTTKKISNIDGQWGSLSAAAWKKFENAQQNDANLKTLFKADGIARASELKMLFDKDLAGTINFLTVSSSKSTTPAATPPKDYVAPGGGAPPEAADNGTAEKPDPAVTIVSGPKAKPDPAVTIVSGPEAKPDPAVTIVSGPEAKPDPAVTIVSGPTEKPDPAVTIVSGPKAKPDSAVTIVSGPTAKPDPAVTIVSGPTAKPDPAVTIVSGPTEKHDPAVTIVSGPKAKPDSAVTIVSGPTAKPDPAVTIVSGPEAKPFNPKAAWISAFLNEHADNIERAYVLMMKDKAYEAELAAKANSPIAAK